MRGVCIIVNGLMVTVQKKVGIIFVMMKELQSVTVFVGGRGSINHKGYYENHTFFT